MVFENLQCPACGAMNTVDSDKSTFTCLGCGKEAITQAAAAFTYGEEESIKTAPMARTVSSDDEERKMLRRASLFLEDEDWPRAWSYFESVLDYNPENAQAYVGELLVKLRLKSEGFLSCSLADFGELVEYKRALRFADEQLRENLQKRLAECRETIHRSREKLDEGRTNQNLPAQEPFGAESAKFKGDPRAEKYERAKRMMGDAETVKSFLEAARLFKSLGDWKDSPKLAATCLAKGRYLLANRMRVGMVPGGSLEEAARLFDSLGGWEDSEALAADCRKRIAAAEKAKG